MIKAELGWFSMNFMHSYGILNIIYFQVPVLPGFLRKNMQLLYKEIIGFSIYCGKSSLGHLQKWSFGRKGLERKDTKMEMNVQ